MVVTNGNDISLTLHAPSVFIPHRGVAPSAPVSRSGDSSETKHGAHVGVTRGQREKNARSWGVLRSTGVVVVPWPWSRWPIGSLFDKNRGLTGQREGEFKIWHSSLLLKGRLVLFPFSKKKKICTIHQFSLQQKANVCALGFVCWHVFESFYTLQCLAWINFARKLSVVVLKESSLWQVRQAALCWHFVLSTAAFLVFIHEEEL